MGKIKLQDSEGCEDEKAMTNPYVGISNWRSLQIKENEKYIIVTTKRCVRAIIYDITLDEFHEINYCCKTVYKPYSISVCSLACELCDGSGKTDWVKKIMGRGHIGNLQVKPFDRNPKGEITILEKPLSNKRLYISSPKLDSSQEICPKCYGSGLHHVQYCKIVKKIFVKNC